MENKLIHSAMAAIMKEVPHIGKDKRNAQQGFNYRGIDDMYNILHKAFADNGVIVLPEVLEIHREERQSKAGGLLIWTLQKIKFHFSAIDGSEVSAVVFGEAMDSADKGCNKSNSVAMKYALIQMFLIPTTELASIDPDGESPQLKSKAQVLKEEVLRLIEQSKDIDDLKQLKEMYHDLFLKDGEVKAASMAKYSSFNIHVS